GGALILSGGFREALHAGHRVAHAGRGGGEIALARGRVDGPRADRYRVEQHEGENGQKGVAERPHRTISGYQSVSTRNRARRFMAVNNFPPDHDAGHVNCVTGSGIFRYRDKGGRKLTPRAARCARETQEMAIANEMAPVSRG